MELGAVPIACAMSALSPDPPLSVFIVRKKAKAHGTGQAIEGRLRPGEPVIVVDDVVTTGESTLKAVAAARQEGAEVVGLFALLDRQEGHLPELEAYADRFHPLLTLEQFRARRARR
jgi:orotate phosphoribosyltransferase